MKEFKLYTDGSCLNNGNNGTGGYCAILLDSDSTSLTIKGGQADTTNVRMEMLAIIKGLEALKEPSQVELYCDCEMLVNAINLWLKGWIINKFKKRANVDLWKEYLAVSQAHEIKAIWIRAHNGDELNEMCNAIAFEEASSLLQRIKNDKNL